MTPTQARSPLCQIDLASNDLPVIIKCNGAISKCDHFKHLLVMITADLKMIGIDAILTDYLHLVHEHDDDKDFGFIHNTMNAGNCDVLNCNIYMRNHRNRNKTNLSDLFHSDDVRLTVKRQILDKIHCYYIHSFDIGHRLTLHEKANAKNISSLVHILQNKHKIYRKINQQMTTSTISKFVTIMQHENNDHCDNKQNDNDIVSKYSFGIEFDYDHSIRKKYQSFKEEITSNKTAIVTVHQFTCELKKAEAYLKSFYCKKVLIHKHQKANELFRENNKLTTYHVEITAQHILSILAYCNYNVLQYEFTKTYRPLYQNESRESICRRHEEFYFLAKYLTQTVHRFGQNINSSTSGKIKRFYHGITETLLFSLNKTGSIESPLSTSASKEVAINFTSDKGLLVEFGCGFMRAVELDVSWCSDFSNEKEHLFIQSGAGLKIVNITDIMDGFEFEPILQTMHILNSLDVIDEDYNETKGEITARLIKQETETGVWDSLNIYAKQLFHLYCSEVTFLQINWKEIQAKYMRIHQVFKSDKYNCIDFARLVSLYPNIEELYVSYMNLCVSLLEDLVNHLKISKIDELIIYYPDEDLSMAIDDVLATYEHKFIAIGFDIGKGVNSDSEAWLFMNRKY